MLRIFLLGLIALLLLPVAPAEARPLRRWRHSVCGTCQPATVAERSPVESALAANVAPTDLLQAVNQARTARGLKPLAASPCLTTQAQSFAAKQPRNHNGMMQRLRACGQYGGGECLAWGQRTQAQAVNTWLNSPPHRAIMLGRYGSGGAASAGTTHVLIVGSR